MTRADVQDVYKLSPVQQGLLFHTQLEPGSQAYIDQYVTPLPAVDEAAFRRALQAMVDRHPVLRTAFVWKKLKEPVQAVYKPGSVTLPIEVEDWRHLDDETKRARLEELRRRDRSRGFDLGKAPALRITVVRYGSGTSRVVWTYHHLILDGWSVGLMSRELVPLYQAAVRGEVASLEPVRPFRDYIRWLARQDRASAEAYWHRVLAGADVPTPLGIERSSAVAIADQESFGAVRTRLDDALGPAVHAFARQQHVTLPVLLQAVWALVLGRYTGRRDVVFGLVVSGRPTDLPGVQRMLGCFINTLPVRIEVDPAENVGAFLAKIQRASVDLRAFEHSPLVDARRWAGIAGDRPLFESILVYEGFGAQTTGMGSEGLAFQRTNYPLAIGARPDERSLTLFVGSDRQRIDDRHAHNLLGHMTRMLASLIVSAETPLGDLDLLGDEERAVILERWSRPEQSIPDADTLHSLVTRQAEETPEATAITFDGLDRSYAWLLGSARRLAHHLRARSVGPEIVVGVALPRSPELIVAILAVLEAGGGYLPLDPGYPDERLRFMIDDADARVVITDRATAEGLPAEAPCLYLDAEADAIDARSDEPLQVHVDGDHPAYVIYTSGSTGRPKGVVVPHRAVAHRMQWVKTVDLDASAAFLQKTTISFDVAVAEIFAPLVCGGRCVLPVPGGERDTGYLLELIADARVTHTSFPPTLLGALLDEPRFAQAMASVRSVVTGGETVPADLPPRFYARLPDAVLENRYGPTEATISVTAWPCPRDADDPILPIGRPIGGAEIYLLDPWLRPSPEGVVGEIFIGGTCLARGYLGRPARTATAFVPHPFAGRADVAPGARLYRTGDLARWRADGAVEFVGRADHQIKIRGFRVELGEIEAVLAAHPEVREAAVVDVDDAGGRRLAAFVTLKRTDTTFDDARGRTFLGERLPAHMVPSTLEAVPALPTTPTGKVDRAALRTQAETLGSGGRSSAAILPRTPTESLVATIWEEVLSVPSVGADDDFFALGGHSLLATQVVSRLRKAFDVEIPLRTLFDRPTVEALASAVEDAQRSESGVHLPPLAPTDRTETPPLSFAQERLLFLDQLEPASAGFNIPAAIRLEGHLDVPRMERALQAVVDRHESLRATFTVVEGRPHQQIAERRPIELPLVSLDTDEDAERAITAAVEAEVRRPFDLASDPPIRARLLHIGERDHVAVLTTHHIVSDGWSMGVFVRELAAFYRALGDVDAAEGTALENAAGLPPLPIQYRDFAQWQRGWMHGEALAGLVGYWRDTLEGAPPLLETPTDRPRPAVQTFRGATVGRVLPVEVVAGLRQVAKTRGATLFMVLLGTWAVQLARRSGQRDIVIGTPIANRNRAETEGLIGFFVNALALRLKLDPAATFEALVDQARDITLGAYAHQDLPFEKLVAELSPTRALSHSPVFQVMLVLQNAPMGALDLPDLTIRPVGGATGTAKYDLTLTLVPAGDALGAQLEYNTDLFDRVTAERWLAELETLARAVATGPDREWRDLALLSDSERQRLVSAFNDTGIPAPEPSSLPAMFAAQAAKTPDRTAVSGGGEGLTYRQLADQAQVVSARLRELGISPDTLVAVAARRTPRMVAGLLGISGAGGAYLPVDLGWPTDRIETVLTQSGAMVIVADRASTEAVASAGLPIVVLEDLLDGPRSADNPVYAPPALDPAHLAYVIFTSGSTGSPKGVAITHGGLANYLQWAADTYHLAEGDGTLVHSSLAFDLTVTGLWTPLIRGNTAHLIADDGPSALLEAIGEHRDLSLVKITPAHLELLGRHLATSHTPDVCRTFVIGGEALPPETVRRWQSLSPRTRLINEYGPTETVVGCCVRDVDEADGRRPSIPIGTPIANTRLLVVDDRFEALPVGIAGELMIGGAGLARGYLGRPALTAARFVPDPHSEVPGARLYCTGDLARHLAEGGLEYLGRNDHQVKWLGFRIELGEIEAALTDEVGIEEAVALIAGQGPSRRLAAAAVPVSDRGPDAEALRERLAKRLPDYMLPAKIHFLGALPLTTNGKVDRAALDRILAAPETPGSADDTVAFAAPVTDTQQAVADVWRAVLDVDEVGLDENFFDLGGHSLMLLEVHGRLAGRTPRTPTVVELFRFPTVRALAEHLDGPAGDSAPRSGRFTRRQPADDEDATRDIAIVGMAGRFPGAADLEAFWANLRDGVESITFFTPGQLEAAGVDPTIAADPRYVAARGLIEQYDAFDADFFGIDAREATLLDPQQRVLLEAAWHALEDAGCDPARFDGRIGVFAGASPSTYLLNLVADPRIASTATRDEVFAANKNDFLASRVSYKLDLTGPSINVQSACSTSLVATCMACDSLVNGHSDLAIAGGVSIEGQPIRGYLRGPKSSGSPDGHTRAFDARGGGTVPADGVGLVVLKRLADAITDGDAIRAVIRGWAVNNDGSQRVGFTAPGFEGQAAVLRDAHRAAGVEPDTIGYVEAHGTATPLGDPIEVAALATVFGKAASAPEPCAVGALKTNVGHMAAASGVAGLIKTVLAVEHGEIPPSLHFDTPNPEIDFAAAGMRLQASRGPWPRAGAPRRAAVSSFGHGGTNAHMVVEQAPAPANGSTAVVAGEPQLLVVSARTEAALDTLRERLADHLTNHPEIPLADVAHTLQQGRRPMPCRWAAIVTAHDEAAQALRAPGAPTSAAASPPNDGQLERLAAAWCAGETVDWSELGDRPGRTVRLPAYPFARRRFWVDAPRIAKSSSPIAPP